MFCARMRDEKMRKTLFLILEVYEKYEKPSGKVLV
jgi:hypothetical protein